MIRTLIVDDEPLARERLRTLLQPEPDIQIIGECADGRQAVMAMTEQAPDLVFLDIQMPGLDGMGVLQAMTDRPLPVVVFVTAYDQYALQAFDVHALDYLLKPFTARRFQKALERARAAVARDQSAEGPVEQRPDQPARRPRRRAALLEAHRGQVLGPHPLRQGRRDRLGRGRGQLRPAARRRPLAPAARDDEGHGSARSIPIASSASTARRSSTPSGSRSCSRCSTANTPCCCRTARAWWRRADRRTGCGGCSKRRWRARRRRRAVGGALPVAERRGRYGVRVIARDRGEAREQRPAVIVEAEQPQAGQDAREAQVVVVAGVQPAAALRGEVRAPARCAARRSRRRSPAPARRNRASAPAIAAAAARSCASARNAAIVASRQDRRLRVERARLRQREQPLDVVVHAFEPGRVPRPDLRQRPAARVGAFETIEAEQRVAGTARVGAGHAGAPTSAQTRGSSSSAFSRSPITPRPGDRRALRDRSRTAARRAAPASPATRSVTPTENDVPIGNDQRASRRTPRARRPPVVRVAAVVLVEPQHVRPHQPAAGGAARHASAARAARRTP